MLTPVRAPSTSGGRSATPCYWHPAGSRMERRSWRVCRKGAHGYWLRWHSARRSPFDAASRAIRFRSRWSRFATPGTSEHAAASMPIQSSPRQLAAVLQNTWPWRLLPTSLPHPPTGHGKAICGKLRGRTDEYSTTKDQSSPGGRSAAETPAVRVYRGSWHSQPGLRSLPVLLPRIPRFFRRLSVRVDERTASKGNSTWICANSRS